MKDALGGYLERVRVHRVLPHVRGTLLDVGCGANRLVAAYRERAGDTAAARESLGVDVHPWPGVDAVVHDTRELPFAAGSFDTVTIIAALNHIPYRQQALAEVRRVMADDGRLVLTMIPPGISRLWHLLRRPWDDDQVERGMAEGEVYGLTREQVRRLIDGAGLRVVHEESFMLGVNRLTVAAVRPGSGSP